MMPDYPGQGSEARFSLLADGIKCPASGRPGINGTVAASRPGLTERADQPGPDPGEFERHLGYPPAPNLDIDRLRSTIGRWRDDLRAAGMLAGDIALAAAQLRLAAGHDAVLPQFLGRAGSLEQLENLVPLENRIWLLPLGFPGLLSSSRVLVDQAVQDGFSADALGAEAGAVGRGVWSWLQGVCWLMAWCGRVVL